MFGMGGSEIIVILIVALLFLGPDKLPEATKAISKGIRDIKKQSRALQQSIEDDETIGGALRDIKSALRGEEPAPKPKPPLKRIEPAKPAVIDNVIAGPKESIEAAAVATVAAATTESAAPAEAPAETPAATEAEAAPPKPLVTLSAVAGEADPEVPRDEDPAAADQELAAMIRPAAGTVAKGAVDAEPVAPTPDEPKRNHG